MHFKMCIRDSYSSVHRVTTESYDLTSQMPALYLLEALARRVYNRLLE